MTAESGAGNQAGYEFNNDEFDGTVRNIHRTTMKPYPSHHRRYYDQLNPMLLNIFTKNRAQIGLQMTLPGFAFNYTFRDKMHDVCKLLFFAFCVLF